MICTLYLMTKMIQEQTILISHTSTSQPYEPSSHPEPFIQEAILCVNAHFQNGITKKRIHDLSKQARKQLLHAKARWPSAIKINLWPYALCNANNICNTIPDKEDGSSPHKRFCRSNIRPKLCNNHTFGCPIYELKDKLRDRNHTAMRTHV
jgi:hypothetical protein